MLTIFHTADWHLGQQFFGFDRDYEHGCFLDWLLQELAQQQPDALLVAGDVFDSINPSAQSLRRFYNFLAGVHAVRPELQIVATAGNHDAGARLEAPAGVLESLNVTVVGTVRRNEQGEIDHGKFLVPLRDSAGIVRAIVMAVPFLRPSDVPLMREAADPYLDGIRELYRQVTEAARIMQSQHFPGAALIAMGHCHLHGGEESRDSERALLIGGAEALAADIFADDIAYVALGHLHKAQQFSGGRIQYSGSPFPLSFSESCCRHRLLRLSFEEQRLTAVDEIPIPRPVAFLTVPGSALTIEDVIPQLEALASAEPARDDSPLPEQRPYLEVRVLEVGPDPTRRKRIEHALEGKAVRLASIKLTSPGKTSVQEDPFETADPVDLKTISPEEVFLSAHRERYNGLEADAALIAAFREILLGEVHTS